ncbi:MAG: VWA domain-containing protein [Actinobacteria bacterium]|nr:VWA domain-containing protein [Actinomycetota bacterium]
MTLLAPSRLVLLVVAAALVVAYVALQRRRRHRAVRHPDVRLVASVAPRWAGWRRHVTAASLLLAVVALVVGLARPARSAEVARKEAVVMLAVDVSGSMAATDVAPNRLAAAVAAAKDFVGRAPASYRIGLVAFDTAGRTVAPPTTDRATLARALDGLRPTKGTAAGEGLLTALDVIDATTAADGVSRSGTRPYAAVVLLADGANTVGRSLPVAARAAADRNIPVFTITFGKGARTARVGGRTVAVNTDRAAMAAVAATTRGTDYTASSGAQLATVYDRIGTRIGSETRQVELTVPFAGLSAVFLALGFASSLLWSPRLV